MTEDLYHCLDDLLLNRESRLDRFDANYIDDFHHIMQENYDVDTCKRGVNSMFDTLLGILEEDYGSNIKETASLKTVSEILKKVVEDEDRYAPRHSTKEENALYKHSNIENWDQLEGNKDVGSILEIQAKYSLQQGVGSGRHCPGPRTHFNARFPSQKHALFRSLNKNSKVISVGNRWKSEIVYIRGQFNLPNTIGLDLFSEDRSFVVVGDIHDTSFADNTFDVVYQKNTFNKLYDLRKALTECIRILKPGGLLVSDDCYDYSIGVSALSRTSVTTNKWYFSYLRNNISEVILDIEEKVCGSAWLRNTGLFAIRIKK